MGRNAKRQETIEDGDASKEADLGEAREKEQIPFGVAAIRAGIEVHGIWLSASTPRYRTSEQFFRPISHSSISLLSIGSEMDPTTTAVSRHTTSPRLTRHHSLLQLGASESAMLEKASLDTIRSLPTPGTRLSYQPKLSSQLRYGSLYLGTDAQFENFSATTSICAGGAVTTSNHDRTRSPKKALRHSVIPLVSATEQTTSQAHNTQPFRSDVDRDTSDHNNVLHTTGLRSEQSTVPITSLVHDLDLIPNNTFRECLEGSPSQSVRTNHFTRPSSLPGSTPTTQVNTSTQLVNSGFVVLPAETFSIPRKSTDNNLVTGESSGEFQAQQTRSRVHCGKLQKHRKDGT